MNINFELVLFYGAIATGVVCLIDYLFFAKARQQKQAGAKEIKLPLLVDYSRSFFPVLLLVFLLRAFLFEPFRIPSGSLEPTLLVGDFILVNKFDYGVRLPVIHKKIMDNHTPQRGDIMIFRWPPNPAYDFIKRVIGVPGDHIKYIDKELYVNGQKMPQEFLQDTMAREEDGAEWKALEKREDLAGFKHRIMINPDRSSQNFEDIVVPPGMYFMMGDNRDDSADSRFFGFVPEENIVGKAVMIWMSWDNIKDRVRWDRIGTLINKIH